MNQLKRTAPLGYEDLMRELELIEHQLMREDSSTAMNLMALESKIRERFQYMEQKIWDRYTVEDNDEDSIWEEDELTAEELKALIPKDLDAFPSMEELETSRKKKKSLETVGMAALLALITALGVFGLASILQLALSWVS